MDLVSLGTICDVVPLIGLNRAIVKQGLKIINLKNLGLKTLIEICKIENKTSTYHLGYIIGPRINAGGRVENVLMALSYYLNNNPKESFQIALELENLIQKEKNWKKIFKCCIEFY